MKFAYMIMAHEEPYILKCLIDMLDYSENDIYLHIDIKSSIDKDKLQTHNANLHIMESQNVTWGGQSQILTELNLLAEASKTTHDYYHLISGVDLPLKNHSDMLKFFEKNKGYEFIGIAPKWAEDPLISQRYKLHWLFQDKIGKKKNCIRIVSRSITKFEKLIGFIREKGENIDFYGGPNWFSITEKAVKCILQDKEWIISRFKNTFCCDEIFAQTILMKHLCLNDIYKYQSNDCYAECLRFAVFKGTSPQILEIEDLNSLLDSGCLFARKFGTEKRKQRELVDEIYKKFKSP